MMSRYRLLLSFDPEIEWCCSLSASSQVGHGKIHGHSENFGDWVSPPGIKLRPQGAWASEMSVHKAWQACMSQMLECDP